MSRFSRRDFLITTAGAALAARGAGSATAATAPKRGGTLTATWGGLEPQSLFVPAGGGSSPYFTSTKVHERLLRLTADLKFEPVLALEIKPAVRAQVINLLGDLQQATGVSYLFISHDLSVVEHVSDRLIVIYLGRIIESGRGGDIWRQPAHPYTCALMAAAPARGNSTCHERGQLMRHIGSPANALA